MRTVINSFLAFILLFSVGNVMAQKGAEEIITESSEPSEDIYIDDIVSKRLIVENRVLPYEPIREADIGWEKRIWRIIETREKLNLSFRYEEKPFFIILQEIMENGDITVFEDEKFESPLTIEQVQDKLSDIDTITTFDYDTNEEQIKIVRNDINWEDINRFRVKEIWFFDEESSTMKVRIIGVAPLYTQIDEDAGYEIEYPLFWVYYPEAREFLSKYRVFNEFNDIAPMTWSDLFESRFFASYIYKQSNVFGMKLADMFDPQDERAGIDLLLESQKIKNELFNFEHDLWTY